MKLFERKTIKLKHQNYVSILGGSLLAVSNPKWAVDKSETHFEYIVKLPKSICVLIDSDDVECEVVYKTENY